MGGSPTKLNPVRRNARAATVTLSTSKRASKIPDWPLRPEVKTRGQLDQWEEKHAWLQAQLNEATDKSAINKLEYRLEPLEAKIGLLRLQVESAEELEREIWAEVWEMPQAEMWERMRAHREVAQYCRFKAHAELGSMEAVQPARMLGDRLGLTPKSMNDLRWTIPAAEANPTSSDETSVTDARKRFKAV